MSLTRCSYCYKEYDDSFGGPFCPKCESILDDAREIQGEMDDD